MFYYKSAMMLYGWFVHRITVARATDDVVMLSEKQKDENSLISVGSDC